MAAPWWDPDYHKLVSGPEYRIFVGNLPCSTDDRSLKDAFSSYGPQMAEVVYDTYTGRSRGFGFVYFGDQSSVDNAIQDMNGKEVGGRIINVNPAADRPRRWRA